MIKSEYLKFLRAIKEEPTSPAVCKLANIILVGLDDLIPLGTHQGQRIRKIVELAQINWTKASFEIQPLPERVDQENEKISQLRTLTVGPFRGFAKQEVFDLASRLVLIYGPNGTGKSSFCEALEYALLGNVAEAENKRFRNQLDYLKNAYVDAFEPPTLLAMDKDGNEIPVSANESVYSFCFVEKNRIDNFSRIAAQTPARQSELISTLFGLDVFNDFVRNFSSNVNENYIDVKGLKAEQLKEKRQQFAGFQQQIESYPEELKNLIVAESELVKKYRGGISFDEMVEELRGNDDEPGLLQQIESDLQQPLATKANLTVSALTSLKLKIDSILLAIHDKDKELLAASQQIAYKELFEAVRKLKAESPENCPACKTPLIITTRDPYELASEELQKLQHLAELQLSIQNLNNELQESLNEVSQIISKCCRFDKTSPLNGIELNPLDKEMVKWWNAMDKPQQEGFSLWNSVEALVRKIEENDKKIDKVVAMRAQQQQRLRKLRELDQEVTVLKTRRKDREDTLKTAQLALANFDKENSQLIADVDAEKSILEQNKSIVEAYRIFVEKLNEYKNGLPGKLVADLGELVVTFYNAFNRYDSTSELLSAVKLPVSQNQRLEISFIERPDTFFDALHILSEGHIRCMGLAILAAKNIKENCPLLIFDDPVNAIDDEHRRAIRETLFVDQFFQDKQIILTIHGEEFFNNTHQLIGKEASKQTESYIFYSRKDGNHIQVNSLKRPKNYVLAAKELVAAGEYRDSLMSARRALENLCEKIWFHYGKYSEKSDDLISVARRGPSQPWDLRMLAENLKTKINRSRADIPGKERIVAAFTKLLGTSGGSPCWTYLNKGTHEESDLPEFDQQTVIEIVDGLELLDNALNP